MLNDSDDQNMSSAAPVLFDTRGRLGIVTLNRPGAINALNHEMVLLIRATLDRWVADDSIAVVALIGAGNRGLCAGGDIVSLYLDARAGGDASARFFRDEYALDAVIAHYPKPFVAVMSGVVLGGGVGLSAHAEYRIVTESSSIGMPETTIGFVPDVGGTWLLSRAPGEVGTHLALTSARVGAADAIMAGLADWMVPDASIPTLLSRLESVGDENAVKRVIDGIAVTSGTPELQADREWIDHAYETDVPVEILRRLSDGPPRAQDAAAALSTKSPTAVHVTLASLRRAKDYSSLEEALEAEYRVSMNCLDSPDFAEGVRAQLIDKDRRPQWKPATLAEVHPTDVEQFFTPAP